MLAGNNLATPASNHRSSGQEQSHDQFDINGDSARQAGNANRSSSVSTWIAKRSTSNRDAASEVGNKARE
jgi:hypothetical protein